ncbi:MAG: hypothetical protein K6T83_21405, partial [Alicyclobacillus sp.]|nr:hypothetical protein [Alicyclobacillus sp.]
RLLETRASRRTPVQLGDIWRALVGSPYLQRLGCCTEQTPHGLVFVVRGIPGVEDGTRLTVSPDLYERGLPGHRVHFASYGDPAFDAILSHILSHPMPAGIHRVSVTARGDWAVDRCGYVVACRSTEGDVVPLAVRHVTGFADMEGLEHIATGVDWGAIAPHAEEELRAKLSADLEATVRDREEKRQTQRVNEEIGRYHAWLTVVTADRLMREVRGNRDHAQLRALSSLREYEDRYFEQERIRIPLVPARPLQLWLHHALAVDPESVWSDQDTTPVVVGFPYIRAGHSVARRMVDWLRTEQGSVTLQRLLTRLADSEETLLRELVRV